MADGKIEIITELNNKNLKTGISQVNNLFSKAAKEVKAITKSIENSGFSAFATNINQLQGAFSSITGVISSAVGVVKQYGQALFEASEIYKIQLKAEETLATAIKNNPYLDRSNIKALKDYASELQQIGNVGDETLLPYMAQLAAAGRTQEQIQSIMSTALDISASGTMSLESAVRNLNKTFSGLSGELGEAIPQVRELTQEELKQGKAVDVLAEQYKGMAESTADAHTQMKNAAGDLQEEIGRLFSPGLEQADMAFKGFLEKLTNALNSFNNFLEYINLGNQELINDMIELSKLEKIDENGYEVNGITTQSDEVLEQTAYVLELTKERRDLTSDELTLLILTNDELRKRGRISEEEAKKEENRKKTQAQKDEQRERQRKAREAANASAASAKKAYDDAIREKEEEIAYRKSLGEEISKAQEELELAETRLNASYSVLSNANITEDNSFFKDKNFAADKNLVDNSNSFNEDYANAMSLVPDNKLESERLEEQRKMLEEHYEALGELTDEYAAKKEEALTALDNAITEAQKQENLARLEEMSNSISQYVSLINQAANVVNSSCQTMIDAIETEAELELATLETKYRKGEITEEEYEKKKSQIEYEAAKKKYNLEMTEWATQVAMTTASIAQGVAAALAKGTVGIAEAAMVSALGAVQIATVIGSKPIAPKPSDFANGGIVQGSSWSGDNVKANVNSGEMILNAQQQKALWDVANNKGSASGGGFNIVVNNNAANLVSAQPQIDKNQIMVMIDARVNESLRNGKYNQSLAMAEEGKSGSFYGGV